MTKCFTFLLVLLCAGLVCAQDEQAGTAVESPAPSGVATQPAPRPDFTPIKLSDFEGAVIVKLREQFPRLTAFFTVTDSYRLPDYGPLVSVTIQPPSTFFVRPVLGQLEQKQKSAEVQAKRVRDQIDAMAQLIRLRAKEADLVEKINVEQDSGKKGKTHVGDLQKELDDTRKSLQDIETQAASLENTDGPLSFDPLSEGDLDNMIRANYQDLVRRITEVMSSVLTEHAAQLELKDNERVTITTSIRDNYLGNPDQTIVFILKPADIRAFRAGSIDSAALRSRILIQLQNAED